MDKTTIAELFAYNDWARDRVMAIVRELPDNDLDSPFEMGHGTLRKTVEHIFAAEWGWFQRWNGRSPRRADCPQDFPTIDALMAACRDIAEQRNRLLADSTNADLDRVVVYTFSNSKQRLSNTLGRLMLHVCNHGTHHRAQVLNMLRRFSHQPPSLDLDDMHVQHLDA